MKKEENLEEVIRMNQNQINQNSLKNVHQVSIDALKGIYYVIIAIAITEALNRTFLKDGNFLGLSIFRENNLYTTLLLFAFIPTISRYVHGASIHLGAPTEKRYKLLIDYIGFFLQASFFYLMAISITDTINFTFLLTFMLSADAGWLIFLKLIKYINRDKTQIQWLISDFFFIIILIALITFNSIIPKFFISLTILITSSIFSFLDYYMNRDFYFPIKRSKSS